MNDSEVKEALKQAEERQTALRVMDAASDARIPKRQAVNAHPFAANPERGTWDFIGTNVARLATTGFLVALIGPRGTGKTQMAAELVRLFTADKNYGPSLHCAVMEIYLAVRGAMKTGSKTEAEALATYITPRFLVIDEIQERGESPWEDRLLTYIIDKRYGGMKDTLLIGNLRPADLLASLGASIKSRLDETGGTIEATWGSFRK